MKSKRQNCFTMPDDQWAGYEIAYTNHPEFPLENLMQELQEMSNKLHDGHYSIFKFTTGYKVAFGTPELFGYTGRFQVQLLPNFKTLNQAIEFAVMWNVNFESIYADAEKLENNF